MSLSIPIPNSSAEGELFKCEMLSLKILANYPLKL